ncbi:MAG: hypothetical protein LCH86_20850 [Proteobacteria bacterium]|nr:hypothetical protein [Pseudomonadota bacterium]
MSVRVIVPPDAIVSPADIAGAHAADDAAVMRMINAATREIEGPSGWLGRSLGPQTLELSGWFCTRRIRLPFAPIMDIVSVVVEDCDGNKETADPSTYRLDGEEVVIAAGASWVTKPKHLIRYKAGYDGAAVADGGTGPIPDEAKQAIILMVQHMKSVGATENLFLRSEEVEGVGVRQYTVSDQAEALVRRTVDNLLSGLRIYT